MDFRVDSMENLCYYLMNKYSFINRKGEIMPKSKERCQEIRMETRSKILHDSMLHFAKNGFAGTRISDLAKQIGIGQGTLYIYFKSKEELFHEIFSMVNISGDVKKLKTLAHLPISAKKKIEKLSHNIMAKLAEDELFAAKIALNTQMLLEQNDFIAETAYQSELYQVTEKIVEQGQKEGSVVEGTPLKLADYYWGVIYLYALKKLFVTKYEMISEEDLARVLLKDK